MTAEGTGVDVIPSGHGRGIEVNVAPAERARAAGADAGPPPRRVGLVGCGRAKRPTAAPARMLYTGALFRASAAYAQRAYDAWWIVSAHHGLVHPDVVLEPYDFPLTRMSSGERRCWATRVAADLARQDIGQGPHGRQPAVTEDDLELYLHVGRTYRAPLLVALNSWSSITVHVPLAGRAIGEQLRWYAERNRLTPSIASAGTSTGARGDQMSEAVNRG